SRNDLPIHPWRDASPRPQLDRPAPDGSARTATKRGERVEQVTYRVLHQYGKSPCAAFQVGVSRSPMDAPIDDQLRWRRAHAYTLAIARSVFGDVNRGRAKRRKRREADHAP